MKFCWDSDWIIRIYRIGGFAGRASREAEMTVSATVMSKADRERIEAIVESLRHDSGPGGCDAIADFGYIVEIDGIEVAKSRPFEPVPDSIGGILATMRNYSRHRR